MKAINIFITTLIISGCLFSSTVQAQKSEQPAGAPQKEPKVFSGKSDYRTAIDLRAGGTSGLTLKHFIGNYRAKEGIIGFWPDAFSLTGLYEWYFLSGVEGLKWYYGAGAHVAFETDTRYYYYSSEGNRYFYRVYRQGSTGIGIDGLLGIEYKILPVPFALSFEIKPFVELINDGYAYLSLDPGLGIKVTF